MLAGSSMCMKAQITMIMKGMKQRNVTTVAILLITSIPSMLIIAKMIISAAHIRKNSNEPTSIPTRENISWRYVAVNTAKVHGSKKPAMV